jgi:hypothetical protein
LALFVDAENQGLVGRIEVYSLVSSNASRSIMRRTASAFCESRHAATVS